MNSKPPNVQTMRQILAIAFLTASVASAGMQPAVLPLSSIDGSNGFRMSGLVDGDLLGISADGIGDFNGDGIDDFLVTAEEANGNRGSTYIVFGRQGMFPAQLDLGSLIGSNGLRIDGSAPGEGLNTVAAGIGDVNDDGFSDVLFGHSSANGFNGRACVVHGRSSNPPLLSLQSINGSNGFCLAGGGQFDNVGKKVASLGDFNGDGIDDFVVGAELADFAGNESGSVYVIYGSRASRPALIDVATMTVAVGFRIDGAVPNDRFGSDVDAAGDLNGDGLDDLVVGAELALVDGQEIGVAYIVFGSGALPGPVMSALSLNGSNGFRMAGPAGLRSVGRTVDGNADINSDGIADILIGTVTFNAPGGYAFVVFGRSTPYPANLSLSALDGSNGFQILGANAGDRAGEEISHAGDLNGDGIGDIALGAQFADPAGAASGSVYVVYGTLGARAATLSLASLDGQNGFRLDGTVTESFCGLHAKAAGDVNHDGGADLLLTCHVAPEGGTWRGSAYLVYGQSPDLMFVNGFEP